MGRILDTEPAIQGQNIFVSSGNEKKEKAHKIPPLQAQPQNIRFQSWKSLGDSVR